MSAINISLFTNIPTDSHSHPDCLRYLVSCCGLPSPPTHSTLTINTVSGCRLIHVAFWERVNHG